MIICFSSLAGSVPEATELHGFTTSLQNDLQAVANVADRIDQTSLSTFMNIIEECKGQLLTSGIGIACIGGLRMSLWIKQLIISTLQYLYTGKSGLVAQRFAGSLSSVGILANLVNAAEWIHGDLGNVSMSHQ